jgi:hypothetical protein
MHIQEIRLKNVRGFHDARDVVLDLTRPDGSLAGWTVLAGPNGSGKTSLLRAIALTVGGPLLTRTFVPDFENWISAGKPAAVAGVRVLPGIQDGDGSWDEPFSLILGWGRKAGHPAWDPAAQPAAARSVWDDDPAGWLCAAYGPFRRLTGGGERPGRGPAARMSTLFHDDASLAGGVAWLVEQHLRSLEQRTGASRVKKVALAVLGDGLLPGGCTIDGIDSEGLRVARNGRRFPLRELGDGSRTIVALVADLLKQIHDAYGELPAEKAGKSTVVTAPGVVLIDEIDAHLDAAGQRRIGEWLKRHFPRIQFIVTTHSPLVCQAAGERGVIRLPGPDEQQPPRILDATEIAAEMAELSGHDSP